MSKAVLLLARALRLALPCLPALFAASLAAFAAPRAAAADSASQPAAGGERFAALALACVDREYPNKIAHVLASDADLAPPRRLTPAFFGCYDWHSAVHGHWLLARLARQAPQAPFAAAARRVLAAHLTPERLAGEVAYLARRERISFERPYGLAWLLELHAELHGWQEPEPQRWAESLRPLSELAATRLTDWLPKLSRPIRIGEHDQTAFALGLALDWARSLGDGERERLFVAAIHRFYDGDRACPLTYEPSGQDFLSPCLAEADVMRRVLAPTDFADWLGRFLPALPRAGGGDWLEPGVVTDPTDPKLAHLDGLNLSRAWMLEGIAAALPANDARRAALLAAAARHRAASLPRVTGEQYEGGHWLGTFATYLTTGRGLRL